MRSKTERSGLTGLPLMAGAVLISFAPVFVRISGVGPATAGFYRLLFGGLALSLAALVGGRLSLPAGGRLGLVLLAAVLFALDLAFWHRSIHHVGPGLATVLGNFQVFVLAIAGILFFRERPGLRFFAAVLMAMLGVFLLVGTDWRSQGFEYRLGVIEGLITAVFYGAYLITLRRVQSSQGHAAQVAGIAAVSLLSVVPMFGVMLLQGESLAIPDLRSGGVLLAYGVLCQGGGWLLISRGLPRVTVSAAGLFILLQPTLSFVWDVLFFARPLRLTDLAGAALALGAIYLGTRSTQPPETQA
jgi:drug/metabolite transporter (DMT)-like permease